MIPGYVVYMHENKYNHKKYIGITCQIPKYRWGQNGERYIECPYFWKAIQKYGWDSFDHKLLLSGLTPEEAARAEIDFIKQYRTTDPDYGYNLSDGGFGGSSEIMKSKWTNSDFKDYMSSRMREAWKDTEKRQHRSERAKERWSKDGFKETVTQKIKEVCGSSVICVETQKIYPNICDVEHELGLNHSNICRAIRTGYRCGGYHWQYYNSDVS